MTRLPQRVSLVAQTAAILREEIQSGAWSCFLPGEHDLCARLQVSRVTLRGALAQLEREKLLRSAQGRRREVVLSPRKMAARAPSSTVVALLTPMPLEAMQRFVLYWIDALRGHLSEAGFSLEVHVSQASHGPQPSRVLEALASRVRPAGWVLYQSTAAMQQWFSERSLSAVITGSRHAGVLLPSVDIDYRATCRHAAGAFLAKGHRALAFLNPNLGLAGDTESAEGFREAVAVFRGGPVEARDANHDGTIGSVCRQLEALFGAQTRPTALLVSQPQHVLTVMSWLAARGVRLPQDVSLISRDYDRYLDHLLPAVTHYRASANAMANRISRAVLGMVRGGGAQPVGHRIVPEFIAGATLAAAPSPG